jgi:hypothetical protein
MLEQLDRAPSSKDRPAGQAVAAKLPRDQRLDFFRGLGMLIIFTAHAPGNPWNDWIPARFGFSSATELFVFCSGIASAFAFGTVFLKRGWQLGTVRVAHRAWQVYWAHIGLFIALAALAVAVSRLGWGDAYAEEHVAPIQQDAATAILGLVTLRWLPGYLDILPMYLVILALIPAMMMLRGIHAALPFVLSGALYAAVWLTGLNLVADPWTGFGWFFNPFAWQAIFFLGFALGMGWVHAPALGQRGWLLASALVVLLALPLSFWGVLNHVPDLARLRDLVLFGNEKTDLHPARIIHFLAVAYLVLSAVAHWSVRLDGAIGRQIIAVGQQSLASFLLSLVVARLAGIIFMARQDAVAALVVNLAALGLIVVGARAIGWIKSSPWAQRRPATSQAERPLTDR